MVTRPKGIYHTTYLLLEHATNVSVGRRTLTEGLGKKKVIQMPRKIKLIA